MTSIPSGRPPDAGQESLIGALRTGFRILRVLMIVLLIAYAASGVFRVESGEQGLIVRLGRLVTNPETKTKVFGQGWRRALPDPLDEKIRLSGRSTTLVIDTFCFSRSAEDQFKPLSTLAVFKEALQPGLDGAMMTGDLNLAHGLWRIEYRIADGEQYVRTVGETVDAVKPVLQRVTETAIMREAAWRRFEDVTRGDVASLAGSVRDRLRSAIEPLKLGIEIVGVVAETIEPPSVRPAYEAVTAAENEKKSREDQERAAATQTLNETAGPQYEELLARIREYGALEAMNPAEQSSRLARQAVDAALERSGGRVASLLRRADALGNETYETIKSQAESFTNWSRQYERYPRVTRMELWNQMLMTVLGAAFEVFYVPESSRMDILTNRDPDLRTQREIERLQKGQP